MSSQGKGTYLREERRMDQGQGNGISSSKRSLGRTSGFGPSDEFSSNAMRLVPKIEYDVGESVHQQQRPSAILVPKTEFARDFEAPDDEASLFHFSQKILHPELFYQPENMEMGGNYGNYYSAASPTAVTGLGNIGNGNAKFHLPTSSNFPSKLLGGSSSTFQLPPIPESYLESLLGAADGAPAPPFCPTTQWTNNLNLQNAQQFTALGATSEMKPFGGLNGFSSGGRSSNVSRANTQKLQGPKGIRYVREMGESSSSRNVKMKMTMLDNVQESTEFELGSVPNPTTQGNGNPDKRPRVYINSVYDPKYEEMGLPIDPHLRMFLYSQQRKKCNM